MSLPDRSRNSVSRLAACALLVMAALVSACTVRPLYTSTETPYGPVMGASAGLRSIIVAPVNTRPAQEFRNHIIFLFNGGAGQPDSAPYTLYPGIFVLDQPAALIQVATEDRPTAGTITMISNYILKDNATGKTVFRARREVSASYDRPRQEFAALRAKLDAQNRAARELAQLVSLDIGQRLEMRR